MKLTAKELAAMGSPESPELHATMRRAAGLAVRDGADKSAAAEVLEILLRAPDAAAVKAVALNHFGAWGIHFEPVLELIARMRAEHSAFVPREAPAP